MSVSKSPECIAPSAFDHIERQQSAKVGIFNLISTMIGGGVLSLPYAISRSGLIVGFLMLTISAMTSVFSFDILVSSARRTGSMTYQQIGFFAFGSNIQHVITFLLLCLTYMAGIGYCILTGDLFVPIVCYIGGISKMTCGSEWLRRIVIGFGICSVAPFCYMRQIKALQYTSIISIASVIILAGIIASKTLAHFDESHEIFYINSHGVNKSFWITMDLYYMPKSFSDIIYVFPVFFLSFMCHFNIPQVHSELTRPTRKRMRLILITVVLSCYILYSIVAFFGYFYSFEYTCGNILLNYDQTDIIINIARLSLGFVILFTFPLLVLPARSALHNLLNLIFSFKSMNIIDDDTCGNTEISKSFTDNDISIHKHGIFDESDESNSGHGSDCEMNNEDVICNNTKNILNHASIGAAVTQSIPGYALFGNNNNNNNSDNNRMNRNIDKVKLNDRGNEDINSPQIISPNIKKLQVLNKLTPPPFGGGSDQGSPPEYSRSTHSLLSRSQHRHQLAYNTFRSNSSSVNAPNNPMKTSFKKPKIYNRSDPKSLSTSDLLLGLFKKKDFNKLDSNREDSSGSKRSAIRGFTTRSFSNLNSPLRGPEDALGVINEPKDIEKLRGEDFTKSFKNFADAKNFKPSKLWLIGETTLLIGLSLLISFLTSSIMVLWGIVGSTVTFVIAFTLPGMFYFKIRYKRKGWTLRNIISLIVVSVSCVAIILCTWQALCRLDALPCPNQPAS